MREREKLKGCQGSGFEGFRLLILDVRMKVLLPYLTLPQMAAAEKGKPGGFVKSSKDLFKKL